MNEYPDCAILQSAPLDAMIIGCVHQLGNVIVVQEAVMVIDAIINAGLTVTEMTAIRILVHVPTVNQGGMIKDV